MNKLIKYFDLASEARPKRAQAKTSDAAVRKLHWFPQYLAVLAGIIVQPFIQRYMASGVWDLKGFWGWLTASIVIAVIAFPGVYKQSFDVEKPLSVQLAVIFATGMGWQSLVGAAVKGLQAT